MPQKGY